MNQLLIVGLGNPGPKYELTRHNIGFLVLDRLADKHQAVFAPNRYAETCSLRIKNKVLVLAKPQTFMNLSGKAVLHYLKELKLEKENLLVITDDLALPFGVVRVKPKGSDGGHNGLKSIQDLCGGINYPRLRVGIGSNFEKGRQADYVLSAFDGEEMKGLVNILDKCCLAIESFALEGIDKAMNNFNG